MDTSSGVKIQRFNTVDDVNLWLALVTKALKREDFGDFGKQVALLEAHMCARVEIARIEGKVSLIEDFEKDMLQKYGIDLSKETLCELVKEQIAYTPKYGLKKRFESRRHQLTQHFQPDSNGIHVLVQYIPGGVRYEDDIWELNIYDLDKTDDFQAIKEGYWGQWVVDIAKGSRPFHNVNCLYDSLRRNVDARKEGFTKDDFRTNTSQIMFWRAEGLKAVHQI